MSLNICFLLGALYILSGRHVTAQSTTALLLPREGDGSWPVDDAQPLASSQTTSSLGSTQHLDMAGKTLSIQLKLPTPTSADPEIEDLTTTVPILETQTELPSNANGTEAASKITSSSVSLPLLPAITLAAFNPSENTTSTQSPASNPSTSITTISQQATTVYVAQITPSTSSQTLEAAATETESFLEQSGITTSGSKANIAVIGLGAGCGVFVLVVVSGLAMWLLYRRRGRGRRVDRRDANLKLERQGD